MGSRREQNDDSAFARHHTERLSNLEGRADSFATKADVANIEGEMKHFATQADVANVKVYMWASIAAVGGTAVIGIASIVASLVIRFWPA